MISAASVKVGSEPPIDLLQHVAIRAARSLAGIGPEQTSEVQGLCRSHFVEAAIQTWCRDGHIEGCLPKIIEVNATILTTNS